MLLLSLLSVLLISIPFASSFQVVNHNSCQDYYFRLIFKGVSCGTISKVEILQQGAWRTNNQYYSESDGSPSFAWDYTGVKFSDMLPISIRITATGRTAQTFSGIIKNLNADDKFSSSSTACGGTLRPTTSSPSKQPTPPTTPYPTAETKCIKKDEIDWTVGNNQIYLNGNRFNLKGLSWFGFEGPESKPYGLDRHSRDWYFKWMTDRGFNAIRLPFAASALRNSIMSEYVEFVKAAGEAGIFVMLDMHSEAINGWRDGLYTIDKSVAIQTWRDLAKALVAANVWNAMFVDVFNEPHDVSNDQWGDWVQFCEDVGKAVWEEGLNSLIAVEGTGSSCPITGCSWGGNLIGPRDKGIVFDLRKDKFVWSPHIYGQDVTGNTYYTSEYKSKQAWGNHFGYLATQVTEGTAAPTVIGEFGTKYQGSMVNWLNWLVDYLISIDQRGHFYWCLNPNSDDTGGVLKSDWTSPETAKLAQLDKLQPNPSVVTVNTNTICVSGLGNPDGSVNDPGNPATTKAPTPAPTPAPVSSGSPSSGGKCTIKQNGHNGMWWQAFEVTGCPSGVSITKLEYGDTNNYKNTWLQASQEKVWGGNWYVFGTLTKGQMKGKQKFRLTTNRGRTTTSNVFSGPGDKSTGSLSVASAFNEDDGTVGNSGLTWPGIAGIIVAGLLIIGCCIVGGIYYKKRKGQQGQASFQETQVETPRETPEAPPQTTNDNDDGAEIEVEMNATETQD